jgi:hypothetical protein
LLLLSSCSPAEDTLPPPYDIYNTALQTISVLSCAATTRLVPILTPLVVLLV